MPKVDGMWIKIFNEILFTSSTGEFSPVCQIEIDGNVKTSIMITDTAEPVNLNMTVRGKESCTMRILAVGGGGGE